VELIIIFYMSSKNIKKTGGSSSPKKKMAGGGPNANGYGKKLVSYPISGSAVNAARNKVNATKAASTTKKTVVKKTTTKKKNSKAMNDQEFDKHMNKKYGTMTQEDWNKKTQNSVRIADTSNPSNVGKTEKEIRRGGKDEPVAMIKNEVVKIPTATPPKITRTAMIPVGQKGGAMKKMKKMTYRKGGSKKSC
jgi:hypothetical protein